MKTVGVVLSGCGFMDGAEIHEAVLTLYFLDRAGARVVCMAPDRPQAKVVNHLTGEADPRDARNVLRESARIARGEIQNLKDVDAEALDALVLPGGFGAALNLSEFAEKGSDGAVVPELEALVRAMHSQGKPIGAICIAPAVVALILGKEGPALTIGSDPGTAEAIASTGARHVVRSADDDLVDEAARIVTTPAYMCGTGPAEVGAGIEKLVSHLLALA